MTAWITRLLAAATLCGLLAAPAAAAPPKVKDDGKLFDPDSIKRANEIVADIDREFHREVVVETFKEPPADKKAEWEKHKKDAAFRRKFFRDWSDERFRANGVTGVYVLVYRESKQGYSVIVRAGEKTKLKDFTDEDGDETERIIAAKMKDAGGDSRALIDGLTFIKTTMDANQKKVKQPTVAEATGVGGLKVRPKANESAEGGSIMGWLCPLIGALLIGWVVIALIRSFTGAGRPQAGYGPGPGYGGGAPMYGGGGGGGFMSTFLGGMFGAAAGNWMYDSFLRGGHTPPGADFGGSAHGAEPGGRQYDPAGGDDAGRPSTGGDGGQGGDYSDTGPAGGDYGDTGGGDFGGGDFGDSGDTGGDFGGGDFGGGDFGGGDFGGGDD